MITWLVLVLLFRALLLPLVAVALNLLTVGASFVLWTDRAGPYARPRVRGRRA